MCHLHKYDLPIIKTSIQTGLIVIPINLFLICIFRIIIQSFESLITQTQIKKI